MGELGKLYTCRFDSLLVFAQQLSGEYMIAAILNDSLNCDGAGLIGRNGDETQSEVSTLVLLTDKGSVRDHHLPGFQAALDILRDTSLHKRGEAQYIDLACGLS